MDLIIQILTLNVALLDASWQNMCSLGQDTRVSSVIKESRNK